MRGRTGTVNERFWSDLVGVGAASAQAAMRATMAQGKSLPSMAGGQGQCGTCNGSEEKHAATLPEEGEGGGGERWKGVERSIIEVPGLGTEDGSLSKTCHGANPH